MNQIEKKINRKSIFKKNCRAAVLQKFFALLSFSLVAEGCLWGKGDSQKVLQVTGERGKREIA